MRKLLRVVTIRWAKVCELRTEYLQIVVTKTADPSQPLLWTSWIAQRNPSSNYQAYAGRWTLEEALIIHQDPIVNHQVPNTPQQGLWNFIRDNSSVASENELRRRASPYKIIARERSERYLKILSLPKNKDIVSLQDSDPAFDYALDESAGAGSYVYVFDSGFDWNHRVRIPRCP